MESLIFLRLAWKNFRRKTTFIVLPIKHRYLTPRMNRLQSGTDNLGFVYLKFNRPYCIWENRNALWLIRLPRDIFLLKQFHFCFSRGNSYYYNPHAIPKCFVQNLNAISSIKANVSCYQRSNILLNCYCISWKNLYRFFELIYIFNLYLVHIEKMCPPFFSGHTIC